MKILVCLLCVFVWSQSFGQQSRPVASNKLFSTTALSANSGQDSIAFITLASAKSSYYHSGIKPLVIPAALIAYSVWTLNNHSLRQLDWSTKNMIARNTDHFRSSLDNYLQFGPAAAVYGLNAAGIQGKNNFTNRSLQYIMSMVLSSIAVTGIKRWAAVTRPDGSAANSFPSGHTTTAFVAAEFLHQEFKHKSVWYSVGGYAVATATGVLRMYNNRHFLSDVVAGAGLGMLSTKLVYLVYPAIKNKLWKKHTATSAM